MREHVRGDPIGGQPDGETMSTYWERLEDAIMAELDVDAVSIAAHPTDASHYIVRVEAAYGNGGSVDASLTFPIASPVQWVIDALYKALTAGEKKQQEGE